MAAQNFVLASQAIRQIWYDAENEVLWIKFNKVKDYPRYRFEPVPADVVASFLNAGSAGEFYHSQIKGNYYTTTIDGPNELDVRPQMFNLMTRRGR